MVCNHEESWSYDLRRSWLVRQGFLQRLCRVFSFLLTLTSMYLEDSIEELILVETLTHCSPNTRLLSNEYIFFVKCIFIIMLTISISIWIPLRIFINNY